jgi:hypothetical protein
MSKEQPIRNMLAAIPNPFLQDRVDSPWQEAFLDVPDINRTAFQSCLNSIKAVWQGNQSRGLILHGEPGTGKTHLLQRLRRFTQEEPRTWFIYLPPPPGLGHFWRHLLECFFYDICQRSKQSEGISIDGDIENPEENGPGQGPLSQIEEALTRHLLNRPLSSTQELARLWANICKKDQPGEPLFNRLQPTFNHLTVQFRLDPDVMKVLRHYLSWNHRGVAYAYLIGRDLSEEDLRTLGIMQSLDDEERARQAVLTFCRLAGERFTIILAFDQIEGLQFSKEDLDSLRAFAIKVGDLMSQCRNLLILSAVQTYFLPTLKNSMHISYYHRIGQDESNLTTLTRDTGKRLIEFRLGTQKEVYELRQMDASLGALWPFAGEDIDQMIPPEGFPARDLLRRARNRFDELKQEVKLTPKLPAPEALSQYWNELFEKQLQKPHVRLDEGVYEDGLLRILQTKSPRGYKVQRGMERDVQVLLEGPKEKIGVSLSNSENMTSLAKQLGRLQEILSQGRVNGLVFIRDARLPISTTAKVTQQRLHELTQKGMHIIRPPAEAYAALNVLRELWNKAAENDLPIGDSNVSMGELQKWLLETTPRPLQDLIDASEETAISHPKDLADELLEVLKGLWIMPLKDVAQKVDLSETALAEFVVENLEVAGLLTGPPEVIFLNPEAVSRT